jgi:iron complex outermembrane receptor protein
MAGNKYRSIVAALMAAGFAAPVLAQENTLVLEEVIVTAQKRVESLAETPMTVSVMTGEQIADMAAFDFTELTNLTAGLSIFGSGFDTNIATRGLGTDLNGPVTPRVTVYLDGAFISQQRALFSNMYDLAQVELLRGPQGTLYGQASPAGALTIQSRNPNMEEIDGYIQQSFTEHSGSNTQFGLSLPIIKNELSVRVSGLYDSNENSDVENVTLDKDLETEVTAYRVVGVWQPTDSFNLRLAYHDIHDERDIDTVVKGDGIDFDDRISLNDYESTMDGETDYFILEMNYEINDNMTATFVASEQDNELSREWDADSTPVQGQEQYVLSQVPDLYNFEARLASQGNDFWDWTVGAFYQDSESSTPVFVNTYVALAPNTPLLAQTTGPAIIDANYGGLFTHNSIYLTEKSTLTVGLRYIEEDRRNSQTFETVANLIAPDGSLIQPPLGELVQEGVAPEDQETDDDAFTGTLKYQYQFTDDFMSYVSYDRGWRGGTTNIAGAPQPPEFGLFDPEESDNVELGFKWAVLEGRGLWNMAVFYQVYSDFQYQASVEFRNPDGSTGLETPVVNVDEAEVYGFDTDISILLSEQWSMTAALSYNKTELTDADNVPCDVGTVGDETWDFNTCDFTGERAGNEPEWSANLSSEYFHPIRGGSSEWYIRGLLNAESEYYSSAEQDDLDSYTTLDLFLGWRTSSRNWDARVWVKNVFDESAELNTESLPAIPDFANGGEVDSGLTWVRKQLDPRTIGVTLGYNF